MNDEIVKILAVTTNMAPARINNILRLAEIKNPDSLASIESLKGLSDFMIKKSKEYAVELESLRSTRLTD